MKKLFNKAFVIVAIANCMSYLANGNVAESLPKEEVSVLKDFFHDFQDAFNSKDVDRVRILSGNTWDYWKGTIDEGKFASIEILDIRMRPATNVVTRCVAVGEDGISYPAEVVFTMGKVSGSYCIEKIAFPTVERMNKELIDAKETIFHLIAAINSRDYSNVKGFVSFGDAADFEADLSARGLSWIKEAIDNRIMVPRVNISTSRDENDVITGCLNVPCAPDGTNVLRKVVFKNGKIDRAAPRDESQEERHRRAEENLKERLKELKEGRLERSGKVQ